MKFSKLQKRSFRKSFLVLCIFFSTITLISSQNFAIPTTNTPLEEISYQKEENFEEYEILFSNFNLYATLSITSSILPDENLLIISIPFLSLFLVSNVIIVIKRQNKSRSSENLNECLNYRINIKITEQESMILELVKDYLAKNRFFEIDKVISYINISLPNKENIPNKNGIERVINNLIKKNILVDGSKLTRIELLENQNRLMIYKLVLENPGIHFMKIVNYFGMSIFLVKWHINMLLKFKLIKKANVENREIYYDTKLSEDFAKRLHFINRAKTQKIIEYLQNEPDGRSKYRISKDLKLHPITTTKYIQKLEELDVVISNPLSNKTLYTLKKNSLS